MNKDSGEWKRTFDAIPDFVTLHDKEHRIVRANKAIADFLGKTCDELEGKYCYELLHNKEGPIDSCPHSQTLKTHKSVTEEVLDPNIGIPLLVTTSPYYDENGEIIGSIHLAKDISLIKKAQVALWRKSKVFMDSIDPIIIEDLESNVIDINSEAERAYGWKREEFIKHPIKMIVPQECHNQVDKLFALCIKGERIRSFESLRQNKSGEIYNVLLTLFLLTDEINKPVAIATISKNITEQKEAEKALRDRESQLSQVIQELSIPAFVINKEHNVIYWNKACEVLTGVLANEMIGTNKMWTPFYPKERPIMADLIADEKSQEEIEKYYGNKYHKSALIEGAYYAEDYFPNLGEKGKWLFFNAAPLRDIEGKIIGAIESLQDISERKKAEQELKTAYDELKSLDALKSDIIANVSHELRTPITIVDGALETLMKEEDQEIINQFYKIAKNALSRQNRIVEDLIKAVQIQVKGFDLELEPIDIGDVISLLWSEFRSMSKEKGVKISLSLEEDIPNVFADFKQVEHILNNLIHNAIKFSKKKGGKVGINVKEKGNMVEVCVSDNGVGISKYKLNYIFDALYQGDASASRSYEGTGMGLWIIKELVEAHDGSISVKSKVGSGSSFYFTLPSFNKF